MVKKRFKKLIICVDVNGSGYICANLLIITKTKIEKSLEIYLYLYFELKSRLQLQDDGLANLLLTTSPL